MMMRLFRNVFAAIPALVLPAAGAISVTDVTQDDDRLVTVTYSLEEDAIVTMEILTNATVRVDGPATRIVDGDVNRLVEAGEVRTITWRPGGTWPADVTASDVKVRLTAWPANKPPPYMVVGLSGPQAGDIRYYASSNAIPGGLLSSPVYRTKRMVFRRIDAKGVAWTMGYPHKDYGGTASVTMTNDYYLGVFEVTRGQWFNVTGNDVSTTGEGYTGTFWVQRPKQYVTMANVRQASGNTADTSYDYPSAPHPDSFLGKMRALSGLDFDLPSEAQWEFAGRAGCEITHWNTGRGENSDETFPGRARYNGGLQPVATNENGTVSYSDYSLADANMDPGKGSAIVGSYEPSVWEIYDIHGNLSELCLDKYVAAHDSKDPNALAAGAPHVDPGVATYVSRGGNYRSVPYNNRTWSRGGVGATENGSYGFYGCRVCLDLPAGEEQPVSSEFTVQTVETRTHASALSDPGKLRISPPGLLIRIH